MTHRRVRLLRCGCKHCSVHVERGWKKPGNPNMAPKLERFVSPGKGNGLRAAVRVQRGELVYCAAPLACVVSNKVSADVCHHCFSRWDVLGHADVHAAFLKSQLVPAPAPALAWYMSQSVSCFWLVSRVAVDDVAATLSRAPSRLHATWGAAARAFVELRFWFAREMQFKFL